MGQGRRRLRGPLISKGAPAVTWTGYPSYLGCDIKHLVLLRTFRYWELGNACVLAGPATSWGCDSDHLNPGRTRKILNLHHQRDFGASWHFLSRLVSEWVGCCRQTRSSKTVTSHRWRALSR